jgi:type IV pilus assembly protein PilA
MRSENRTVLIINPIYKSSSGADDHIELKNKNHKERKMELINKIRKSRKGFTLVEIIVVLVILAILAAFTIPSMIGFVNDARNKASIAQAREVYVAAQAAATETVGTQGATKIKSNALGDALSQTKNASGVITVPTNANMIKYLGDDISNTATWTVEVDSDADATAKGIVTKVTYTDASGYINTITPNN